MKRFIISYFLFILLSSNCFGQIDLSKVRDDYNTSRQSGDYAGIIKNGEAIKSNYKFDHGIEDSFFLLQINTFLSISYNELREYKKSELLFNEVKNYNFCYLKDYAIKQYLTLLNTVTSSFVLSHNLVQAEMILNKCQKIYDQYPSDKSIYLNIIKNKVSILRENNHYEESIIILIKAIKEINNINLTRNLYSDLITNYFQIDDIINAEKTIFDALNLYNNNKDTLNGGYVLILNHLRDLYYYKEDIIKQIEVSERIVNIQRKSSMSPRYLSYSISSLGESYLAIKQIDKAKNYGKEALKIMEDNYGKSSPELIFILNGYGMILENYYPEESMIQYKRACQIAYTQNEYYDYMESSFSNVARQYGRPTYNNNNVDSALTYSKKHFDIISRFYKENTEDYISSMSNLGQSFSSAGLYDSCYYYLIKSKKLINKYNYQNFRINKDVVFLLALYYKRISKFEESKNYFNEWINYYKKYLQDNLLSIITDLEKAENLTKQFEIYDAYASQLNDTSMYRISFENKLILKNLQLNQFLNIKKELNKTTTGRSLSNTFFKFNQTEQNSLEYYELKKKILEFSPTLKKISEEISTKIDELKNRIGNEDAVIEIGKFSYITDDELPSDFYFAMILRKSKKEISYVPLCFEADIEKVLKLYDADINSTYKYSSNGLYDLFIRPLISKLDGIKSIYISNTGLLNKFNLTAFESEKFETLGERFNVFQIASSIDLLNKKNFSDNNIKNIQKIYSFGGIQYGKKESKYTYSQYVSRSGIQDWKYLPGTLAEVNSIDSILKKNNITSYKKVGTNADEKSIYNLENIKSPFVLHIATHGFFIEKKSKDGIENPLDLTGILLSGANDFWNSNKFGIKDSTDGILTGTELSMIDLSNCSLSILSACETGVGKIMNNEGVFGLQRALKLAGVKNCIVSLWKVPDQQTSELFIQFYTNLINGNSFHDSFYNAQKTIREKFKLPYYWASFILIE